MNETAGETHMLLFQTPLQVLLSTVPCLLFLYVNCVLLYALLRKPLLLEPPRYILFGHLLFIDSLHLVLTTLLYLFAVIKVTMISYFYAIIMLVSATTVEMSPLNLAVMCLER